MTEATRAIAEHAANLDFDDLPDIVVERAKLAILDTIGVAIAGSAHRTIDLVSDFAGTGTTDAGAAVIGRGRRMPAAGAAFVNGCSAHVLDFDDSGHSSAHTVPTVLAMAEEVDQSGRQLLLGFVAGREVRMRLNEEIDAGRFDLHGRGPGSRGWHATGTLGSIGSAVGAGRVLGLSGEAMAMAIGLSASLASGVVSNFGTMTKCVHVGNAARNGVLSASLVRRGFTADSTVLTSRKGFIEAMCLDGECDIERVAERVQSGFLLEEKGNRIKPYPSCSGTHRNIEAMRTLLAQHDIDASDIAKLSYTAQPALVCPDPQNDLECKFSGGFALVATLLDGSVSLDNCTEEFLRRSDVQELLGRTTELPQAESGWISVTTKSGQELRQGFGTPPSLSTHEEVATKFRRCAEPVIGQGAVQAIIAAVDQLEELPSVRRLTAHLIGDPAGAPGGTSAAG